PGKRYGSAQELAEDLRRFLAGEPIRARPIGRGERLARWCLRHPLIAFLGLMVVVALISLSSWSFIHDQKQADHARHLVRRLEDATIAQVPDVISEIQACRHWADPLLKKRNAEAKAGSPNKLRLSLALLPVDPTQADYLCEHLLLHTK